MKVKNNVNISLNTLNEFIQNYDSNSICSVKREVFKDQSTVHLNTQDQVITPVGRLKASIHKWKQAGASKYI